MTETHIREVLISLDIKVLWVSRHCVFVRRFQDEVTIEVQQPAQQNGDKKPCYIILGSALQSGQTILDTALPCHAEYFGYNGTKKLRLYLMPVGKNHEQGTLVKYEIREGQDTEPYSLIGGFNASETRWP
jgi:hypothetical protein